VDSPDPQATYDLLRKEAASYSKELASKPHVVVLTKADLTPDNQTPLVTHRRGRTRTHDFRRGRQGIPEWLEQLWKTLNHRHADAGGGAGHRFAAARTLVATFGSAQAALDAPQSKLGAIFGIGRAAATAFKEACLDDGLRVLDSLKELGARVLLAGDPDFPASLEEIPEPPAGGSTRGATSRCSPGRAWRSWGAGITRCTVREAASVLAGAVAQRAVVVSGMARGIDAIATRPRSTRGNVCGRRPVDRAHPR